LAELQLPKLATVFKYKINKYKYNRPCTTPNILYIARRNFPDPPPQVAILNYYMV